MFTTKGRTLTSLIRLIDPDFREWYGDLALPSTIPPGTVEKLWNMSLKDFEAERNKLGFTSSAALRRTLWATHDPDLAYHGSDHSRDVAFNLMEVRGRLTEAGIFLPEGLADAITIGVAGHDFMHPGATLFRDARPEKVWPGVDPSRMTVEYNTANRLCQLMELHGYTPIQQLVATYVVWASSFGADKLGYHIQPKGVIGLVMRAIDVLPSADKLVAMQRHMSVTHLETPAAPPPKTWREVVKGRHAFLTQYVMQCMANLDEALECDFTHDWKMRIQEEVHLMEAFMEGREQWRRVIYDSMFFDRGIIFPDLA